MDNEIYLTDYDDCMNYVIDSDIWASITINIPILFDMEYNQELNFD